MLYYVVILLNKLASQSPKLFYHNKYKKEMRKSKPSLSRRSNPLKKGGKVGEGIQENPASEKKPSSEDADTTPTPLRGSDTTPTPLQDSDTLKEKEIEEIEEKEETKKTETVDENKGGKPPDAKPIQLNETFGMIYMLVAGICTLSFLGLTLTSMSDLTIFYWKIWRQSASMKVDPNVLNKDTVEMMLLQYQRKKPVDTSFYVFTEEAIIASQYMLLTFIVYFMLFQMTIILIINVYCNLNNMPASKVGYDIMPPYIAAILATALVVTIGLDYLYTNTFVTKTIDQMRNTSSNIMKFNAYIATNLTSNQLLVFYL
jgi:hypothetical protein